MDASAYLQRQGWRGAGHSLDLLNRGIAKPLLISKKVDVLGVGLKKHAAVSDQWWLRAFDQGLRNFGTGTEGALSNARKHGVNRGGLYGHFVKGEGFPGSIGTELVLVHRSPVSTASDESIDPNYSVNSKQSQGEQRKVLGLRNRSPSFTAPTTMGGHKKRKSSDEHVNGSTKKVKVESADTIPISSTDPLSEQDAYIPLDAIMEHDTSTGVKSKRSRALQNGSELKVGGETVAAEDCLEADKPSNHLTKKKRAVYSARAAKKGMTLDEFVLHREEKTRHKKSKSKDQNQKSVIVENDRVETVPEESGNPGFVVDTVGDADLVVSKTASKVFTFTKGSEFALLALKAIGGNVPISTDMADGTRFVWEPGMPIPTDPRLWEDVIVKELPKIVRKARRQWLEDRRNARKGRKTKSRAPIVSGRNRKARKMEEQQKLALNLLRESRKQSRQGDETETAKVTIGDHVLPLIKIKDSTAREFDKADMNTARRTVRKVLKSDKKAAKEALKAEKAKANPRVKNKDKYKKKSLVRAAALQQSTGSSE